MLVNEGDEVIKSRIYDDYINQQVLNERLVVKVYDDTEDEKIGMVKDLLGNTCKNLGIFVEESVTLKPFIKPTMFDIDIADKLQEANCSIKYVN